MTVKPRYEKKQAPIPASKAPWCQTPELYYAGRAAMDGADKLAVDMEAKWGIGRLRLLVSNEWREKFDRQRNIYNEAIADGALEDVRREAARMEAAWRKLDKEAAAAGHQQLAPDVWEVMDANGMQVIIIVKNGADATNVARANRACIVYSLEEVGRILSLYPEIAAVKHAFPGAAVTAMKMKPDPVASSKSADFEDDIPF